VKVTKQRWSGLSEHAWPRPEVADYLNEAWKKLKGSK